MCEAYTAYSAGRFSDAEKGFREILAQEPNHPGATRWLGTLLGQTCRHQEGVPYLRRAVQLQPNRVEFLSNMAGAITYSGDVKEAQSLLEKCIEINPEFAPAYWNLGIVLLMQGDWTLGMRAYEYGYLCGRRPLRTSKGELWKGEYLGPDQTLFLYWEQGYGDTFNCIRYLPLAKERSGARIILEVQRAVYPLLKYADGAVEAADVIRKFNPDNLDDLPEFDKRSSILSLPFRLGIVPDTIPSRPYLHPRVASMRLGRRSLDVKVGLVWQGNRDMQDDPMRSFAAETYAPLSEIKGVRLYSAQYGEPCPEWMINYPVTDFDQLAALIKGLDLVITTCTATAHLAGAMGKEVWILLCYRPYFLWMLDRTDTPLYPSARLFRQETPGDWAGVICQVKDALTDRVAKGIRECQRR